MSRSQPNHQRQRRDEPLLVRPRLSGASAFSLLIRNTKSSLMIKACPRSHLLQRKRHFSGSRCNLSERGHDRATDTLFVFVFVFPTPLSVSHAFLSFDCLDLTLLERRVKARVSEEPKIEGGEAWELRRTFRSASVTTPMLCDCARLRATLTFDTLLSPPPSPPSSLLPPCHLVT